MRVEDNGPERFLPLGERQANARLIAAAPDLLAAAEAAYAAAGSIDLDGIVSAYAQLSDAIKKARGDP